MAENEVTPVGGMEAFLQDKPEVGDAGTLIEPIPSVAEIGDPVEATEEEVPEEDKGKKFFETFNKRLNAGYKSDEELAEAFKSLTKMSEYDARLKEADEFKGKVDELTKAQKSWSEEKAKLEAKVNPLTFFRDEKAFVAEQLRRQFPDRDPMAIERLITSDLSRMDKMELLAQKMLLDNPSIEGGTEGAKEAVLADMGIDLNSTPEEWDRVTKNKITVRANQARKELEEFQKSVEIPKVKTEVEIQAEVVAHQEGLKKNWTPFLDKLAAIDKLQIPAEDGTVLATIDIPAEWRQDIKGELLETIIASGIEPNEETIQALNAMREQRFIHRNLPKLYTILENQWKSKAIEERDKLLNNDTPPNNSIKPEEKPDDTGLGMKSFLGL